MQLIAQHNLNQIKLLNATLKDAGINKKFKIKEVNTMNEVGAILVIPAVLEDRSPLLLAFKENFKEAPVSYQTIINLMNEDLEEVLDLVTFETEKLLRIKKAFTLLKKEKSIFDFSELW